MKTARALQEKVTELESALQEKERALQSHLAYILQLEEALRLQKHRTFGTASEQVSPEQIKLFDEAEVLDAETASNTEEQATTVQSYKRQKKPRVSIPDDLPREEMVYDLPEDEKICPHDNTVLRCIGSEEHEQLKIIPAQVKVIRHKRLKYACPCCHQHMATAKKPAQPIEKSIASPSLLAYVATQKYCDALPLYRQSDIFQRAGITLSRHNLANWMIHCGQLIQPLVNVLYDTVRQRSVIQMDETRVQVLKEEGKTPQSNSYLWVMASFSQQPITLFHYDPTRSQQVPVDLLDDSATALMVDGYEGYQKACDTYGIARLGCWQHVRSKFMDVRRAAPKGSTGKADQAIAYIQQLYRIEKQTKELSVQERYLLRQEKAKPIVDKIRQWLEKSLPHVPPKMALGKALHYLHNQWERLIRYLEDGAYPIDNNLTENSLRPFVIGRKNWLFSASEAGVKASANLYSLVQTAKRNGWEPYEYLNQVFTSLPNAKTAEDIEQLLPWNLNRV